MKLGAQLFSLQKYLETREDTKKAFHACKAMGYENLQYSGHPIATTDDAHFLKDASDEAGLPIVVATFSYKQLTEDTPLVAEIMGILGASSVMLGVTPKEYRQDLPLVKQFLENMEAPTQYLLDRGIHIAYHNHAYEFAPLEGGTTIMDYYLGHCTDWRFLLDICWAKHAGVDVASLMDRIGSKRLRHIHFKDMRGLNEKGIPIFCPCGSGLMDLAPLAAKCIAMGVDDMLVEQDDASDLPDPLGEIEQSFKYLRKLLRKDR